MYLKVADEELARVAQITKRTLGFYRESALPESSGFRSSSTTCSSCSTASSKPRISPSKNSIATNSRSGASKANCVRSSPTRSPTQSTPCRKTVASRSESEDQSHGATANAPAPPSALVDDGSGISPELLPKIFDPFFTTKQDDGNGLGLWITHDIVTRHGGSIRVRSKAQPYRQRHHLHHLSAPPQRKHPRRRLIVLTLESILLLPFLPLLMSFLLSPMSKFPISSNES